MTLGVLGGFGWEGGFGCAPAPPPPPPPPPPVDVDVAAAVLACVFGGFFTIALGKRGLVDGTRGGRSSDSSASCGRGWEGARSSCNVGLSSIATGTSARAGALLQLCDGGVTGREDHRVRKIGAEGEATGSMDDVAERP